MKFITTLAVVAAIAGASAAALPEVEPWCKHIGQPCPKKRSAEAEPEAWLPFCGNMRMMGRPCPKVKRDAGAEAVCGTDGMPCSKVRRAAEAFAAAIAEPAAEAWLPFCGNMRMMGRPCPKMAKREAACYAPGAPCDLAKREAYALAAATADALPAAEAEAFYKETALTLRDAFPDFEEFGKDAEVSEYRKREAEAWLPFCGNMRMMGRPCPKNKRAASPEAEAAAEGWVPFCGNMRMMGRPCPKKRDAVVEAVCNAEGMPCYKAKRAADAVAEALAAPEAEALPEAAACFAEGEACDVAKRSIDALFEVAADYAQKI